MDLIPLRNLEVGLRTLVILFWVNQWFVKFLFVLKY